MFKTRENGIFSTEDNLQMLLGAGATSFCFPSQGILKRMISTNISEDHAHLCLLKSLQEWLLSLKMGHYPLLRAKKGQSNVPKYRVSLNQRDSSISMRTYWYMNSFSHSVMSNSSVIPWIIAHQGPLSMGLPRQEYWSGLPFPSPGDLPDPGMEQISCISCIGMQILYCWATWEVHIYCTLL